MQKSIDGERGAIGTSLFEEKEFFAPSRNLKEYLLNCPVRIGNRTTSFDC